MAGMKSFPELILKN